MTDIMAQSGFDIESNKFYNKTNISNYLKDITQIVSVLSIYYEGVEFANSIFIDSVFHEDWLMLDDDSPNNEQLHIENKAEFIKRITDHGPYIDYASNRRITGIAFAAPNFAYVRVDQLGATCFFLVKENHHWTILNKIWVKIDKETISSKAFVDNQNAVNKIVSTYCQAHKTNTIEALQDLFHPDFESKEITSIGLKLHKKEEHSNYFPGIESSHPCHIVKSEIFQNKLAIIKLDLPQTNTSVFLVVMKIDRNWKIISERIIKI